MLKESKDQEDADELTEDNIVFPEPVVEFMMGLKSTDPSEAFYNNESMSGENIKKLVLQKAEELGIQLFQ